MDASARVRYSAFLPNSARHRAASLSRAMPRSRARLMAYACRYEAMQAAQATFLQARGVMLTELRDELRRALLPRIVTRKWECPASDEWQWSSLDLHGEFRSGRVGADQEAWAAGVGILFAPRKSGKDAGILVFETRLFFYMSEEEFHRLPVEEFKNLFGWDLFYKAEGYAAVRLVEILVTSTDFNRERLMEAIRDAPACFDRADPWFARTVGRS